MKNPLIDPDARLVIAHRGNRVGAPENTLESLKEAVALGADALEFDVRLTRDGVPVLMHDADVDRTTNGHGLVASCSLSDLRTLDAGVRWRSSEASGPRVRIPTLEEVLDSFEAVPMVIEVKETAAVDATEALVRRFGIQDRVVVGSSHTAVMERLYCSGLSSCASVADAMRLLPRALTGLGAARLAYHVLSITPRFRGVRIPVLRMAAAARKAGIATHVWTVNDPDEATSLWNGGVAGIVTDDPAAMVRARSG